MSKESVRRFVKADDVVSQAHVVAIYLGELGDKMKFSVDAADCGMIALGGPCLERPDPLPPMAALCDVWFREYHDGAVVVQVRELPRQAPDIRGEVVMGLLERLRACVDLVSVAARREITSYHESATRRYLEDVKSIMEDFETGAERRLRVVPWIERVNGKTEGGTHDG